MGIAVPTLRDESTTTKMLVRADNDSAVAASLGVSFGSAILKGGNVLVAATRPTEWLALGDPASVAAVIDQLVAVAEESGNPNHMSTVDLTHGRALFRISGAAAAKTLEKVCSLDWADNMMPDGAVASASVAKVTCDIIRNNQYEQTSYLIASDRSSAQYLFDAIIDAGAEFDIAVV